MIKRRTAKLGLLGPEYRRLTIGILLVMTFVAVEQMSVATVLPAVLKSLGDVGLYGWAFSVFMLAQIVGIVLAGPAVDRIGFTRPLLVAGAGFSAGLIVGGLAPSMPVLIAGRGIQGLAAGVIVVTLNASVGRGYPADLRSRAFAATAVAWVVPSVVGPAIAGWVAQNLTWRLVFLGIVPAVIIGLIVAVPALATADRGATREPLPREPSGAGWISQMGLAAALVGGTSLSLAALGAHRPVLTGALAALGLALLVPSLRSMLRVRAKAPAYQQRNAMIVGGLAAAAFFGTESYLPLALTSIHGRTLTEAGTVLTAAAVAWTIGSWTQVRAREHLQPHALCAIGLGLIAAGVLGVFAIDWSRTPWWIAFLAWALAAAGMGVITNTTTLIAVSGTGGGSVGQAVAGLEVLISLGTAISAGVGGAALAWSVRAGYGRAPGLKAFDVAEATLALAGILVALALSSRDRGRRLAVVTPQHVPGPSAPP